LTASVPSAAAALPAGAAGAAVADAVADEAADVEPDEVTDVPAAGPAAGEQDTAISSSAAQAANGVARRRDRMEPPGVRRHRNMVRHSLPKIPRPTEGGVMYLGICPATLLTDPMAAGPADVSAAAAAAVEAGFSEASVWSFQLDSFTGSGLAIRVLEAATAWAGDDQAAADAEIEQIASMVDSTGATHVLTVTMEPEISDLQRAQENLTSLAERLESLGAVACIEFLGWSAIPDLATAWELIAPLPANLGLVLDTWHWQRQAGGPDVSVLTDIPGERISYLQVCDAAPGRGDDLLTEAMTARLLPGEGCIDFGAVLSALEQIDAQPFIATEIFNPALVQRLGSAGAAVAMRNSALAVLDGFL
jgi:sugar phosphate isomerase/epimerase